MKVGDMIMGDTTHTYPSDTFFQFSSMYSDRLLTEFLPSIKNKSYERYMEIQKNILNTIEYTGSLADFTANKDLTNQIGWPAGSIYYKLTNFELPIVNKKKFIDTFKSFTKPISLLDIIKNATIFNQAFRFVIDDLYFDCIYFIQDKYHNIYIGIQNSTTLGISSTTVAKLVAKSATFFLWREQPASIYQTTGILSSFISDGTSADYKRVTILKSTLLTKFPTNLKTGNTWDICMTADATAYQSNLSYVTMGTLVTNTATTLVFEVASAFVTLISSTSSTIKLTAIHRSNRRYSYLYTSTPGTSPILNLASSGNPISSANIRLYTRDLVNVKRGKPISMKDIVPKYFPAIYDLTTIAGSNDLLIEIVDYPDGVTNTSFENHLDALIQTVGADTYRNNLVNGVYDAYPGIKNYDPVNIKMDYQEFLASGVDLRRYKFDKLMKLMASDPWLYSQYVEYMDSLNFKFISEAGTPKHFKFNTGIASTVAGGVLSGTNPIVNDNGFLAICKKDSTITFDEPNSYLKIHCDEPDAYLNVYVNGQLITPTLIDSYLNDIYVFYPVSKMVKLLQPYITAGSSAEVIAKAQVIIVEVFPTVSRSTADKKYDSMTFNSISEKKTIFKAYPDEEVCLNDLVFYNSITGEYIPTSYFTMSLMTSTAKLTFNDGTTQSFTGTSDEISFLLTNASELYMTKDLVSIELSEDQTETSPVYVTNEEEYGEPTSIEDLIYKKFKLKDLLLGINLADLVGIEIGVAITNSACIRDIKHDRVKFEESWLLAKFGSHEYWTSVCYGGGKYVAVCANSSDSVTYSTDGINWELGTMPAAQNWSSVCYGKDKFVAVATNSTSYAYSTDGITWELGTMSAAQNWSSVCYGKDKFVVVATNSVDGAYSTDGITWVATTLPSAARWSSVCYGKDKFVVVSAGDNTAAYSTDGITWVAITIPTGVAWTSICYGNDKFVTVSSGSGGEVASNVSAYSTDGITWVKTTLPNSLSWASICYGDNKFAAVAESSQIIAYSVDGITWTTGSIQSELHWSSICYGEGPGKFIIVNDSTGGIYSALSPYVEFSGFFGYPNINKCDIYLNGTLLSNSEPTQCQVELPTTTTGMAKINLSPNTYDDYMKLTNNDTTNFNLQFRYNPIGYNHYYSPTPLPSGLYSDVVELTNTPDTFRGLINIANIFPNFFYYGRVNSTYYDQLESKINLLMTRRLTSFIPTTAVDNRLPNRYGVSVTAAETLQSEKYSRVNSIISRPMTRYSPDITLYESPVGSTEMRVGTFWNLDSMIYWTMIE